MASPTVSRPKRPCVDRPLQSRRLDSWNREGKMVESTTPAFSHVVDDLVAAAERDFQRLFDDHVLARPGGGHGRLQVRPAGRADGDHVDRRIGQHLVELVVGLAAGRFGQPSAAAGTLSKQATSFAPRTSAIARA